ncbi:MAG TPA: oligopeptide transporter, OPT family [Candidatus Acidoferrales bacterium]|nr:oligopeptide transporter, OPT family [Candidatus Acidoferrales bacterium]
MTPPQTEKKFRSYVPDKTDLREFTVRAVLLGLVMTVVLGAANLYLGLRAGMTIAATYPAAVIGMAILRLMKGSILEENIARTIGSIGESVAAGAVFTIPAFVLSGVWPAFDIENGYWKSVALMAVGGTLGILFVTLLRRVMVEDPDLPFPESVAAAEIHKAGQQGSKAAQILFANMGLGAVVYFLGAINVFAASRDFVVRVGEIGRSMVKLTRAPGAPTVQAGAMSTFSAPAISPAYLGVGYIIGPRLGALNFAGGVFAWGLLVPLLAFFMGPQLGGAATGEGDWAKVAGAIWYHIVRPIAVGGMMVGASFTLFRMRKNLGLGMKRAVADLKKSAAAHEATGRTQRDLSGKLVFGGLAVVFICMIALYLYFAGEISAAVAAAIVMIVLGFFFAAVSGNLVGMIGSSNNPISGLTLCTLVIAALLMVAMGLRGNTGIAAVLGVAAVVCVSSAVAGEMLQDLKAGHILGGTPAKMQMGDLLGIAVSSLALFFPLMWLHRAYTFGTPQLSAPQAGLMASLAQGIVGGAMAWPLVVVGIFMGFGLILVEVRSPMLFSVGMYLPLETTFAIFVGGLFRWATDKLRDRGGFNDAQKARIENAGVLTASGLIAGEALCGLVVAGFRAAEKSQGKLLLPDATWGGADWLAILVLIGLALLMIRLPLLNAGRPDEPAPPTAIM